MFFPLTRSVINQYFPLNNSFEEDFFARFEGAVMGTPFTYLFDIEKIRSAYPTFDAWIKAVMQKAPTGTPSFAEAAQRYIVTTAFQSAIPILDVVISKGGMLVTDGQGIAPASAPRVERLLKQVQEQRHQAFEILYVMLSQHALRTPFAEIGGCRIAEWQTTLIQDPHDIRTLSGDYYDFFRHYPVLQTCHDSLTDEGIPASLLTRLVAHIGNEAAAPKVEQTLLRILHNLMLYMIDEQFYFNELTQRDHKPNYQRYRTLIDELRNVMARHIDSFPEYDRTTDPLRILGKTPEKQKTNFFA